ncbi:MAG: TIGR02186 family protein [Thermodesulfobacteriota bacterium]
MLSSKSGWRWSGVAWFFSLLLGLAGPASAAAPDLRLSPNQVDVGTFFDGAEVKIQGVIPAGTTAVVEVVGSEASEHLLRKGRRGGLWMSVGAIQVDHAPSLYMLLSNAPKIPELTGSATPWGYAALAKRVKFSGSLQPNEEDKFFQEFMGLKQGEKLYRILPDALKTATPQKGQVAFQGVLPLPAKVPPGQYQVRLAVVSQGRLLAQQDAVLYVKLVGFPAMLSTLARQQGLLYGIMAVIIAIVTGFIMGFLFKGKTAH